MENSLSSVDFTTLKKHPTNTSTSTSTSSKPNTLTRLFTKNRSNTQIDIIDDDNSSVSSSTLDRKPSLFKLGKMNKRRHKKDLTVKTPSLEDSSSIGGGGGGSNGFDSSSESLVATTAPPPSLGDRRPSMSSPVSTTFHNFFHRSAPPSAEPDDSLPRPQVTLSSNNSNSTISDGTFAQVFKFTDDSYVIEDDNADSELFRKLFIPADQVLKLKPNSGGASDYSTASSTADATAAATASPVPGGTEFTTEPKFWTNLLIAMKPILLPSQSKRLSNGMKSPVLVMTSEEISAYIGHSYDHILTWEDEDTNEYKAREFKHDLSHFFNKCMMIFTRDYKVKVPPELSPVEQKWVELVHLWRYFRRKMYYFMVNCFNYLKGNRLVMTYDINMERLLIKAFYDAVVDPLVISREEYPLDDVEFIKKYQGGKMMEEVVQCFGMVNWVEDEGFLKLYDEVI